MKKTLIRIIAIVCIIAGISGSASAQFRYGATAGIDFTTLKFKQPLVSIDRTAGFTAGVMGELMFPGVGFGLDLGMLYQLSGAKIALGEKELWSSQNLGVERCYLYTLAIPIHLRFKYTRLNGFEDKIAPLVYLGPSFNFTLAHSKLADTFNFPAGNLSLDFGLGAEIFKKWQVTASYSVGMTYCMSAKVLTNYSAKERAWNVRVAYFF